VRAMFLIMTVLTVACHERTTSGATLKGDGLHRKASEPSAVVVVGVPVTCDGDRFYRPGGSIKPAVPTLRVNPIYDRASASRWPGSLILAEAFVDKKGRVCGAGVV
jgi:hypothetical protein